MNAIDPNNYHALLDVKVAALRQQFGALLPADIQVFESPPLHYRMRAEFRIWHDGDTCNYAMYQPGERNKPYAIDTFPAASPAISRLMPKLLAALNANQDLKRRLYSVEFLTTKSEEALITLIYHRPLDKSWRELAAPLSEQLGCPLIGRSRKVKIIVGKDYVLEKLNVAGNSYIYQQIETGFTQPNAAINEMMLAWAKAQCEQSKHSKKTDLLELYCGNGNFTVALASEFRQVLATEVSKLSIKSAEYNLTANNVNNVLMVRMSSEEISDAFAGVRPFRRLREIDLDTYHFSTVLVDPPRSGLDNNTVELVGGFDTILYISCNPETLLSNLKSLSDTHHIAAFAVFDQFPYTPHLECGVLLKKHSAS